MSVRGRIMTSGLRVAVVLTWIVSLAVFTPRLVYAQASIEAGAFPSALSGAFVDDYGVRYTVGPDVWLHGDAARYHIIDSDVANRFIIAQNDEGNPGQAGLWTRIDWVLLDPSSEFGWGYCYAVYDAASPDAARAAADSDRDTPRTGCNDFPFTRMRRVDPGSSVIVTRDSVVSQAETTRR